MKFGLNVMGIEGLYGGDLGAVLQMVSRADAKGIDVISTCDHLGFDGDAHAERLRTHGFPYQIEQPWYEPIAFLSAVAAVTERARLSTFVLVATLRPALLLAKQLATLDAISGGRVTIGLGVGWQKQEYEAAGMEFEGRFGRLEELVQACRVLWSQAPASFEGEHIQFTNFHSRPFPVQRDKLPVLLGFAPTDRNFERIARVADGWAVNPTDLSSFAERVAALRKILAAHGRDPNRIEIEVQFAPVRRGDSIDWDATAASAADWASAGATTLSPVALQFCRTSDDVEGLVDWLLALRGRLP